MSVTEGPPGVPVRTGVTVVLQPVVMVTVAVGITQPVGQVGHGEVVTVLVPVLGQQFVLQGTLEVVMEMYMGHMMPVRSGHAILGQAAAVWGQCGVIP